MPTFSRRRSLIALVGLLGTTAAVAPALATSTGTAGAPVFTKPLMLKGYAGGEPSLAVDPVNPSNVYVTAPQFVPAVLNPVLGSPAGSKGVGVWVSHNGGRTFPIAQNIGSGTGGGDSDVEVGSDGTVYVADLEATAAAICTSTDHGKTFTSGNAASAADKCDTVTSNQQGPENDRQWLSAEHGQGGAVYLTYHDFAGGFPIIERSDDHGQTFVPCGTILDPRSQAGQQYSPSNGTLVAKPSIDRSGRIYVEVTMPPLNSPPVGATLNSLYIAVADKGCKQGTVFSNHLIYTNPGADLGKIFNSVTTDAAGNVYVIAAGKTKAGQAQTNVWLFVSHDRGVHWSAPIRVNTPSLKANVMPAVVGGLRGNEVAVGWFGTSTNNDPNYQKNQWRYYVATSFDGGRHFAQTIVTRTPIHYGDICTQGLFCGLIPGQPSNRNLADFDEIQVDPRTGLLIVAFPGDPYNRPDLPNGPDNFSSNAYVVRQVGGKALR
ncbi:MAG TPA: hypothetical protein VFH66_16345 [Mycobacteriales bacterium]|nr:hypothetical protein [Mycobacteriales bacterium]